MHRRRWVHRHKQSCQTSYLFGKTLQKEATLTSDTLEYKAVCGVRAAVFGHKHCEQIAVHMLLIELCRAPIAHCLQSQTEFPCSSFSIVISLPSSSLPYGKTCWECRKIKKGNSNRSLLRWQSYWKRTETGVRIKICSSSTHLVTPAAYSLYFS